MDKDQYLYMPSAWVILDGETYTRIGFENKDFALGYGSDEVLSQIEQLTRVAFGLSPQDQVGIMPILPEGSAVTTVKEFVQLRGWFRAIVVKADEMDAYHSKEARQQEVDALQQQLSETESAVKQVEILRKIVELYAS